MDAGPKDCRVEFWVYAGIAVIPSPHALHKILEIQNMN